LAETLIGEPKLLKFICIAFCLIELVCLLIYSFGMSRISIKKFANDQGELPTEIVREDDYIRFLNFGLE